MNFDDDFFHGGAGAGAPYHHPHLPPYQQQQQGYKGNNNEPIWKTIYRLSAVAGNEKRIGVAILMIFIYQFRESILAFLRRARQIVLEQGVWFLLMESLGYFRSCALVLVDSLFFLRSFVYSSTRTAVEGEGPVRLKKGGAIAERKRRLNRQDASEQACMPELEEVSILEKSTTSWTLITPVYEKENANNTRCQNKAKGWFEDDIEPAFLREEDYPAGWLVFDTVHGIISKEQADILHKKDLLKEKSILPEVKT